MVKSLGSDKNYMMASCLILNSDGSVQKTCRRNLLTPLIGLSESFNLYKISPYFQSLNLPTDQIPKLPDVSNVPAISGAVIVISTKDFKALDGFDEKYFLHVEDMDLCMRVYLARKSIIFVKNVQIKHMLSTSDTTTKFLESHKAKGFIYYVNKFFIKNKIIMRIISMLIWLRYFIKVYLLP